MTKPVQSEEELSLIKEYVLYSVIMDTIEKDIVTMKEVKLKMAEVYTRSLRKVQNAATEKHSRVRKELRNRGIKVYEEIRDREHLKSKFICRGYHGELLILWNVIKVEVEERLYTYMDIDPNEDTLIP
jgi:hypothetical protein